MLSEQDVKTAYARTLGREPESPERVEKCIKRYTTLDALLASIRTSAEYKKRTGALAELYGKTDRYQPVYSRPDLSSDHARVCEDRCNSISMYCADKLSAGTLAHLSILDIGCSQGFVSLYFADRGAHVIGIDYNRDNVQFCRDLAAQTGIDALFKNQTLDDATIELALDYGVNAVFLLSVLHHVIKERGLAWTQALIARMLANGMVLFCELAHKGEQVNLAWRDSLPADERDLFPASAVIVPIGSFSALNGQATRTLYAVHRGEVSYTPVSGVAKVVVPTPEVRFSGVTNAPVRIKQYGFSPHIFTKTIRFTAQNRLEIIRATTSEYLVAKMLSENNIGPTMLGTVQGEQSLTFVYKRLHAEDLSSYAAVTSLTQRRRTAEQIDEKLKRLWSLGLHWNDCREHNILVDRLGVPTFIDFEFSSIFPLEDDARRAKWMLWHFRNTEAFAQEMERYGNAATSELPSTP